jgi:hypothetical protein
LFTGKKKMQNKSWNLSYLNYIFRGNHYKPNSTTSDERNATQRWSIGVTSACTKILNTKCPPIK